MYKSLNNKYLDAHKEIVTVARLSIYSNTILLFIKLIVGISMGSVGVLSETLHSDIDPFVDKLMKKSSKE